MLADDLCIVKHFPEAYLVCFFHQHYYVDAVGRGDIPFCDTRASGRRTAIPCSISSKGTDTPLENNGWDRYIPCRWRFLHHTDVRWRPSKAAPAARAAELLVCRSLGIVKDGEDVTAAALDAFAERFKDQLLLDVIVAMRDLFKLDNCSATDVEEALIVHGGRGALDMEPTVQDTEQEAS
ncbi:hypothetical protein D1007_24861 [Hordeum vulgare]|nr:hypothetical protein D1007_24861 [Hordeum vulgare]